MQSIIIFVGADNAGKTSIAKKLSERISLPYFKRSNEKNIFNNDNNDNIFLEANHLLDFIKQTKHSVIVDRSYPCEYAYSKVYNRKSNDEATFLLDEKYSELNTKIIFCYKTKYKKFEDDLVSLKDVEKINDKYKEFFTKSKTKYLALDTTDENINKQMIKIMKFLGE